ncbi:thiol-disulfide oxidoreductase DCC family protein [Actinospongicola halichondriae]|uniref:thiol-disulfide oxidoreductase DCC family protein n=1 Tax=Actinospongicola halichondriae TaxID=3236844 RepID=UPI003D4B1357
MATTEPEAASGTDVPGLPDHLVFYDGVCGLCAWAVRWLLDHDPHGRLQFAPIQGETAASLGIEWDDDAPPSEASVIFLDSTGPEPRIEHRSRAVAAALEAAGSWPVARLLIRATPRPLADVVYRFVAAIRYRIWGKHDQCEIPSPERRSRFLP